MTVRRTPFILKSMKSWLNKTLKFFGVFVAVYAVVVLVIVGWVASGPIRSTTLTPYIETLVESYVPHSRASITSTLIVWNNVGYALDIQANEVILRDVASDVLAEIPVIKIKLNVLGFLKGRFFPAEMEIQSPRLSFVRRSDGSIWFGGMETGGGKDSSSGSVSLWEATRHFAQSMTGIGPLHDLSVTDALLSVHDEETLMDWAIHVPEAVFHKGWTSLKGNAKIDVSQKDRTAIVEAKYVFDRLTAQHAISLNFKDINPSVFSALKPKMAEHIEVDMPLTGEVTIAADEDINIVAVKGRLEGGKGHVKAPIFWDKQRPFTSAKLEGSYDRAKSVLSLPKAELNFGGGTVLTMKVDGKKPPMPKMTEANQPADMAFTATLRLVELPLDQYALVWPKPIIANASEWIIENLSKGKFTQGDATLKGHFAWHDLENMVLESAEGNIAASNVTVGYIEGMPKIEGVNAEATFDLDHMKVNVFTGVLGPLQVVPFTVEITDFQKNVQNIVLPIKLKGPAQNVVRLMDSPPFGYAKAVGLDPEKVGGELEGTLGLRFPLLKSLLLADVAIDAQARLINFAAAQIMRGIDISQGQLSLRVDTKGYGIQGQAALNKVPLNIAWDSLFDPPPNRRTPKDKAKISGVINDEHWALLGFDVGSRIKGGTSIDLDYKSFAAGPDLIDMKLNFQRSSVRLEEMAWVKPMGSAAVLTLAAEAEANKPIRIKSIDLQGQDIAAKGSADMDGQSMRLLRLDLQPLILGRTNANVRLKQAPEEKGELSVLVDGYSLDISGLASGKDSSPTEPRPAFYSVKVDKLHTSENGLITDINATARRDLMGWREIELSGMTDGEHALEAYLRQADGKKFFRLTCEDFGKALKGLGFTDTVRNGPIVIKGESSHERPRVIEGTVSVGNFTVSGLPILARLLSAASPFGIIDFVTGNVSFNYLDGRFRWHDDNIDLIKINAAGSAFGINIDGRIDLGADETDLYGTLVPFSMFNRIIGFIPLIGDVVTGSDRGGVLAISYNVKGKLADPAISVNPVSLLTPGFLRNLFFGPSSRTAPEPSEP